MLLLFRHYIISWSLQFHELHHARLPCPSLFPGVCSNSCPLSPEMLSNHHILCCLLLLPSVFPSFSISPSNEYSWLISFRIDWFDLFAFQGTLKSLLQHHNLKTWILQHLAFFMVQLLHPYMTTGKTIALTTWTFVGKMMCLLFNRLSRFVIAFLSRSKHLLISWLQSQSAVILETKKIVCHCFRCFPIYFPWSDGTRCHDLSFLNVEF